MAAVILRRRAGGHNWVRMDAMPSDPKTSCHEQILRIFAAQDRLATEPGDAAIMARRFRLVEEHLVAQTLRRSGDQFAIADAEIQLTEGLRFRGTVDPYTLHLLQRCDGARTLGEVVEELLARGGADRDRLTAVVAEAARRLAGLGFLVPATDADRPASHKEA
jgi:hypothetical protein